MRIAVDFDDTLVFYSKDLKSYKINHDLVLLCNILIERGYALYIVTARCTNAQRPANASYAPCTIPHGEHADHVLQLIKQGFIPTIEDFCDSFFTDNKVSGIFYTNAALKGELLKNTRIHVLLDDSLEQRNDAIRNGILAYDVNQMHELINLIQLFECEQFWKK